MLLGAGRTYILPLPEEVRGFIEVLLVPVSPPRTQMKAATLVGQHKSERRKQEQGDNREKEAHERLHTGMKCLCNTLEEGEEKELKARPQGPTSILNPNLW